MNTSNNIRDRSIKPFAICIPEREISEIYEQINYFKKQYTLLENEYYKKLSSNSLEENAASVKRLEHYLDVIQRLHRLATKISENVLYYDFILKKFRS